MSNAVQSLPTSTPTSSKLSRPSEVSNAAHVTKRLQSELMSLMMSDAEGFSAFPSDESDLTNWTGRLEGPEGTYFHGHTYALSLSFPPTYPYTAPTVKFASPCYHPNVQLDGGYICLDILKEKWSPALSVSTILISLQSLLGEPNNRSPLNVEAAELWDKPDQYKAELAKHYRPLE